MVSATLRISKVFHSSMLSPISFMITCLSGAMLNHTTKVTKKTIHDRWRIFIFPVKEKRLNFSTLINCALK